MNVSHQEILQLLEFVESSNVQFLEVKYGDIHIVADRSDGSTRIATSAQAFRVEAQQATLTAPEVVPAAASGVVVSAPQVAGSPAPPQRPASHVVVTAPVVGVFYKAPEPGAPPFVNVGDKVEEGQQVGIIEVMKVFTAVSAPTSGIVTEILAENEEFVEFAAELVVIDPAGGN